MRVAALAIISGLLSYLSVSLPHFIGHRLAVSDDALFVMPGVFFGLFILLPQVSKPNYRILRWIGLMTASVVAWYMAVSVGFQFLPLLQRSTVLSCGLSGSVGVLLLALASRYLVPIRIYPSTALKGVVAGFVSGCLFGMAVIQPRGSLAGECLFLIGFLFWQGSVAMSLFYRRGSSIQSR